MKTKLLAIAIALGSLFSAQQAVAKSSKTKTSASAKKHHHKSHTKKAGTMSMMTPTA